jgi:hypothetical protein
MPNENRPDLRFAMIAEEMTTEVKMTVADVVVELVVGGDGITCPRCGFGAFAPIPNREVVCLGCPDHPSYPLPAGVELITNRYRCCQCRCQRLVTMTLSDVNLHCVSCRRLALHSKQVDPAPSRTQGSLAERVLGQNQRSIFRWVPDPEPIAPAQEARRRPLSASEVEQMSAPLDADELERLSLEMDSRTEVAGLPVIGSKIDDDHPVLARAVDVMMKRLRLDDFSAFAARVFYENANVRKVLPKDYVRGTGRTTKGIVEAIARCALEETRCLWVKSVRPRYDADLCQLVRRLRGEAGTLWPTKVDPMPSGTLLRDPLPDGTLLYVDHSYYEADTWFGRMAAGLALKP